MDRKRKQEEESKNLARHGRRALKAELGAVRLAELGREGNEVPVPGVRGIGRCQKERDQ